MTKELFVSSTPHETKVGLVEDDQLAEIYLERENEYTLAGSIYKGRVTRVLPGMQSAFVDVGLERDAFLYVSDFMELEEHDEDVTDIVPADRGVRDLRAQPARTESGPGLQSPDGVDAAGGGPKFENNSRQDFNETEEPAEAQPFSAAAPGVSEGGESQDRERGGFRGRRRRRGGRRDGRGDGRSDGRSDVRDQPREPRLARPLSENVPPAPAFRSQESGRTQQFGPPAGYQPILLPGESISKYRGLAQPPVALRYSEDGGTEASSAPSGASTFAPTPAAPVAATFPDDEPIFASPQANAGAGAAVAEPVPEPHDDLRHAREEHAEPASSSEVSTSVDWNREFRR